MSKPIPNLTSRFANLNPFTKYNDQNDEKGEESTSTSVAGGGHGARKSAITSNQLRVSHALKTFLIDHKVLSAREAGLEHPDEPTPALQALIDKPHIQVPPELTDRSHPLPEYFISSSHNTYLNAKQLYGGSSAQAYDRALSTGSRCVEIDAWDNAENELEPKVTHGYTLVSNIPFRSVCEAIRDYWDKESKNTSQEQGYRAAPIFISLENHCSTAGQSRLVAIMEEVFGDRLLSKAVRDEGTREQEGSGEHVTLEELGNKICLIVEHHLGDADGIKDAVGDIDEAEINPDEVEDPEEKKEVQAYNEMKKKNSNLVILQELADLGVYAQSVKPTDNLWFDQPQLYIGPHHHLINVSESGLSTHMPVSNTKIALHNAQHLMRIFPKGTRISSQNLDPVQFWGIGAQICALNWQTFGVSLQMNEALFSGSEGYVLKPAALRAGGNGKLSTGYYKKLRLHIAGATDVPVPEGRDPEDIKPYVSCVLVHPDDKGKAPAKRKTAHYHHNSIRSAFRRGENAKSTEPIWDEVLVWEYEDNELVFLRLLLKSDDAFAANPVFAVAAMRVSYLVPGWTFVRMLDLKGRETKCSLLVKFEIVDA